MSLAHRVLSCAAVSAALLAFAPHASAQLPAPLVEPPVFHDGRAVVRVEIRSARDLRTMLALSKDALTHRLDYGPADFIVDADALKALGKTGIPFEVVVPDLGPVLRAEFDARAAQGEGGVAGGGAFFDDFRTLAEIEAKLAEYAVTRPDLVSAFTIGTSLEGRPIRGIRITKAAAGSPGVLFNATQHAREWGATMTAMYIADRLIAGYGADPRVTALLDRAWIDVIPVVNPDGYVYTWTTNRLWRKNRRNNGDGTFGVDLNRNWAFQWGGGGASANGADETFRGPFAFSEPESAAMRDYFVSRTTLAGHIDFHAYSQLVLSPWGYTTTPPANNAAFLALGGEMKDAIKRSTGFDYTVGPIASTLYVASGSSVDHAYGQHGVPSFTIEVRDRGAYGFVMPAGEILPNAQENYAAALELADATVDGAVIRLPEGAPLSIEFDAPAVFPVEVRALRGALVAGSVRLRARTAPGAAFSTTTLVEGAPGVYSGVLPAVACGTTVEWFVEAQSTVGSARLPRTPGATYATVATETTTPFIDTFESSLGWTVGAAGDNATAGLWTRVDPVGTAAQPENDSSDAGAFCFITGQGAVGGAVGAADVDGGTTTLVSPPLDASDADSVLIYRRWYSNNQGSAPNEDTMPVQISGDGGATWLTLETVSENAGAWVEKRFRVADFITPSANVRVRFLARDLGSGSIVEAGVDFVRIEATSCPPSAPDLNGDGTVSAADLAILLSAWGASGGPADLDGNGSVGASDLALLLGAWG